MLRNARACLATRYLDLLDAVDNEHVLQVLYSSVHPVVEGRRPLGKLEVQLVNGLPQLLNTLLATTNQRQSPLCYHVCSFSHCVSCTRHLQCVPPLLGEGPQVIPLVADALAASVDRGSVVVVQLAGTSARKTGFRVRSTPLGNTSGTESPLTPAFVFQPVFNHLLLKVMRHKL